MFLMDSPVSLPLLHPYPKEERAHLQVSLRETNLRLPARSVRLPLFSFSPRGDPQCDPTTIALPGSTTPTVEASQAVGLSTI